MFAIIPAKSHSQRISGKNMKPLNGKPMLQYTIEAAMKSNCFNLVFVSSENEEICSLADKLGATGYLRDKELSSDTATVNQVLKDVLDSFKTESFAVLLPTSPLRTAEDIKEAYNQFTESKVDCLMSVIPIEYPHEWSLKVSNGGLMPFDKEGYSTIRQKLEPTYKHDGSIIMCKAELFLKSKDWIDMMPMPYYSDKYRAVDVNTELDFKLAELLME